MHHQMSMRGSEKKPSLAQNNFSEEKKIMDQQASYFRVQTLVREK